MVLDRPIELLVLIPCKKVVVAGPIVLLVLIACSRLQTTEVKLGEGGTTMAFTSIAE